MPEQHVIDAVIDAFSFAAPDATLDQVRDGYDVSMEKAGLAAGGVTRTEGIVGDVPGAWFRPTGAGRRAVLYLHGGGFQFGSSRSHGPLAAALADAAPSMCSYSTTVAHRNTRSPPHSTMPPQRCGH